MNQCATLIDVNSRPCDEMIHGDSRCIEMSRHEKPREWLQDASAGSCGSTEPQLAVSRRLAAPKTVDDALRLTIKLAVDAGDYARARALLEIAKGDPP
jgi:hypothetical protein